MSSRLWVTIVGIGLAQFASSQGIQRRATMIGGGTPDRGHCRVEVVVDGSAEVELRGDTGLLRDLQGQNPMWRRFECTGTLPVNPGFFRFESVSGRGRQELVRDPRNGGAAVVQISDREGGADTYVFDLFWGNGPEGRFEPRRPEPEYRPEYRPGERAGRFTTDQATRVCQDSILAQARERFHTDQINFRRVRMDDNPGRNDWVLGVVEVRRRWGDEAFHFSCSVNFDTGRVRSAEIGEAIRP